MRYYFDLPCIVNCRYMPKQWQGACLETNDSTRNQKIGVTFGTFILMMNVKHCELLLDSISLGVHKILFWTMIYCLLLSLTLAFYLHISRYNRDVFEMLLNSDYKSLTVLQARSSNFWYANYIRCKIMTWMIWISKF